MTTEQNLDLRGIGAYLALAFGLTWALEIGALARGIRFAPLTPTGMGVLVVAMFVPAVSAFITRRFITREGFATAGLRLGPKRLYPAVWLGVPLLFAAIYLCTVLFGLGRFDPTLKAVYDMAPPSAAGKPLPSPASVSGLIFASTMTGALLITSLATFGEEFGWTGYLLPKLLPLGRFRAAALYGAIWGLWHAPAIIGGYNFPGHPYLGVALMCAFTIALAFIQCALRLRSESVLLTTFFHAGVNTQGRGLFPVLVVGVSPLLGGPLGLIGILVWGALGVALLARTKEPAQKDARGRP